MRLRLFVQLCAAGTALAMTAPALAGDMPQPGTAPVGPDTRPEWREPQHASAMIDPQARHAWLSECRRRAAARDDGMGGAVIGGLMGGLFGNRLAGRGHRTVGTVAGAAVGAVAGAAIDRSEDRGRVRDECEAYLDSYYDYYAYQSAYYSRAGYAPGYANAGCCQPVARAPECTEVVEYEDVPAPRERVLPSVRRRPMPDKRIRVN